MKKSLLFILFFLHLTLESRSQDFDALRTISTGIDISQIKEGLNHGLVYTGPLFKFNYRRSWDLNKHTLTYEGRFGLGPLSTREMLGLNFIITPIDLSYFAYENRKRIYFKAGPWFSVDYNYQLYPNHQSGYSFYFTNINLGFVASASFENDDIYLRIRWKNSLLGLVSRPPIYRNPYFFDLSLGTYFKDQHRTFQGGSFNVFNNTQAEVLYVNPHHPRIGFAYQFWYFTYSDEPSLKTLSHGISILFFPKT
ncbi:MAG: hypothetical protein RIE58_05710 [Vicingaceae bacterium]